MAVRTIASDSRLGVLGQGGFTIGPCQWFDIDQGHVFPGEEGLSP